MIYKTEAKCVFKNAHYIFTMILEIELEPRYEFMYNILPRKRPCIIELCQILRNGRKELISVFI